MICDRDFPTRRLLAFLGENDTAFTHPLSQALAKQGSTLTDYADKLARRATIAWEEDADTGNIKGAVMGYTHDLPADGGSYITQVVTGLSYRKQGVCGRLLQEYLDYCRAGGVAYVWLTTGVGNAAARAAYESAGFQLVPYDSGSQVKYVYKL